MNKLDSESQLYGKKTPNDNSTQVSFNEQTYPRRVDTEKNMPTITVQDTTHD